MRKKYQTMEVEFEYFQTSDVMMASVLIGGNNDGILDDIYDLL